MSDRRQKRQLELAFARERTGEARSLARKGTESLRAENQTEPPAGVDQLMEEVCETANLKKALGQVKRNGGAPGIDGITVEELPQYLITHWNEIRESLLSGEYRPKPVRRMEIPKHDGGKRLLGIPTALDRFVQQALMQVMQRRWEPTFSEHSHGFRPKRSAHGAITEAQSYIAEGYRWVVDIDLEKFFDRVHHDRLMGRIAERVADKAALRLVRRMLKSGVMIGGLIRATEEGTPQGGPLSPLLSNIVLDELDRELERRGHKFVRYADDCNIYVRSERAGLRVMDSVRRFITRTLRLQINENKSAVARPWTRKFLGYSFTNGQTRRRIAPSSLKRFRERVRELTRRTCGRSVQQVIAELNTYLTGWIGYYGFAQTPSVLRDLNGWLRRRLRALIWKQWKTWKRRRDQLIRYGIDVDTAHRFAASSRGCWCVSKTQTLHQALSASYFARLGLVELKLA